MSKRCVPCYGVGLQALNIPSKQLQKKEPPQKRQPFIDNTQRFSRSHTIPFSPPHSIILSYAPTSLTIRTSQRTSPDKGLRIMASKLSKEWLGFMGMVYLIQQTAQVWLQGEEGGQYTV